MKLEMIESIKQDPTAKVGKTRDSVIAKYKAKYDNGNNPDLWQDIISSLGRFSSVDATLGNYKTRALGNIPRKRSQFNPHALLGQLENGRNVKVLDSNTDDLPKNWKQMNIEEEYGAILKNKKQSNQADEHVVDEAQPAGDGPGDDFGDDVVDVTQHAGDIQDVLDKSEWVLVFTTVKLLALVGLVTRESVDGTFKMFAPTVYNDGEIQRCPYSDHFCLATR